jgi:hypothetical protein
MYLYTYKYYTCRALNRLEMLFGTYITNKCGCALGKTYLPGRMKGGSLPSTARLRLALITFISVPIFVRGREREKEETKGRACGWSRER